MPDLKSLDLLVRLAECGSYTQASRQMGISVGAASKIIARLEEEIGTRLLNRNTRLISLTPQGQLLAEKSKTVLAEMNEALDLLQLERSSPMGTVKALMASSIARGCIFPLLPRFQERYPNVQLEISLHDGPPDLAEQGFDIAITDWVNVSTQYISRKLCTLPIVAVASPGYLKRRGIPATVEELQQHDCINVRLASGDLVHWCFVLEPQSAMSERRKILRTPSFTLTPNGRLLVMTQYDAAISAALDDLGITLAYAHGIRRHLAAGDLQVILPDYRIEPGKIQSNQYRIHYVSRKYRSMAQRALVDFLIESFDSKTYRQFDRHAYAAK